MQFPNKIKRVVIVHFRDKNPELRFVYGKGFNLTYGTELVFKTCRVNDQVKFLNDYCEGNGLTLVGEIPWWYPFKNIGLFLFLNTPHELNSLATLFGKSF